VTRQGRLFVVGLGPGARDLLTGQAREALRQAEVVVGYDGYFAGVADLVAGKECHALPLTRETDRARLAVEQLRAGRVVCVISSGDPGVYAMASLVLECAAAEDERLLDAVEVVPGVSAVNAAAALLGAPLGHDFAVVSLSDLLTPWDAIERRLRAAAQADFVLALLNPRSQRRDWQYRRAAEILAAHRPAEAPVGVVRNAFRPGQSVEVTTVARMAEADVDMFTTVIAGNSLTRRFGNVVVTPRGYTLPNKSPLSPEGRGAFSCGPARPDDILAESFRLIEAEVGPHPFAADEWPVVRRMVHASGDVGLARDVTFTPGAVAAGVGALRRRTPIVTDVRMVAAGIHRPSLEALGVGLHCFIDDAEVARLAEAAGTTRSACAMDRAISAVGDAVYVVGNAPTALLALCAAVREGKVRPRLVIAMPVGFVAVAESKDEALALGVPVLAVRGRKGGSAVAAAAVNALLLLARESPR
jgi:precorrin-3B C17-methyltransferase